MIKREELRKLQSSRWKLSGLIVNVRGHRLTPNHVNCVLSCVEFFILFGLCLSIVHAQASTSMLTTSGNTR